MTRTEQLKQLLKEDPSDPFLHFALAQEYQKIQQPIDALDRYLHLTDKHPKYAGTYYHLGKLYEELGRKEEAIAIYKSGIALTTEIADHHALSELKGALTNCELDL